jgi:formate/nitrite transporter FocA (FNT family)
MFSFGLLSVVHYKYALYTGKAGFFTNKMEFAELFLIIIGNFIGCGLISLIFIQCSSDLANAQAIVDTISGKSPLEVFLLAIPCGFIMSTAVAFARKGQYLPLLFGVPLFIVCGFRHSIADIFYYCAAYNFKLEPWLCAVLGNFIGCNIPTRLKVYNKVPMKENSEILEKYRNENRD